MTRRTWVVGWNNPGCLPDNEPLEAETWAEAKRMLAKELSEEGEFQFFRQEKNHYAEYMRASALIARADENQPFSFFYSGLVWWLADV